LILWGREQDKKIIEVKYTLALQVLNDAKLGILNTNWLPSPSLARPERFSLVIKAFQNPVWSEQARERLKQINLLTHASTMECTSTV